MKVLLFISIFIVASISCSAYYILRAKRIDENDDSFLN